MIKMIKSDDKDLMNEEFIMLQKISISDEWYSSDLYIQRNPKAILLSCFQHNTNNKMILSNK